MLSTLHKAVILRGCGFFIPAKMMAMMGKASASATVLSLQPPSPICHHACPSVPWDRRGGIRRLALITVLSLQRPSPICHPAEAKGRDLRCAIRSTHIYRPPPLTFVSSCLPWERNASQISVLFLRDPLLHPKLDWPIQNELLLRVRSPGARPCSRAFAS